MDIALLAARVLLAGIFGASGVAKWRDGAGTRQALVDFDAPARLAAPGAVALVAAELAVAGALLATPLAWYGAAGSLALLVVFMAAIARQLQRGRAPACHCFGQLHPEPVGPRLLVRNALLSAVALFILIAGGRVPGASLVAWLAPLTVFERAVVIGGATGIALLAAQLVLLARLVREPRARQGVASASEPEPEPEPTDATPASAPGARRLGGLAIGSRAPAFSLPSAAGPRVSLEALLDAGRPLALLFADPGCGGCAALMPKIGEWQRDYAASVTLAVMSRGAADVNLAKVAEHGLAHVLLQRDREVAAAYGVLGTPSAVIVGADGTIGSVVEHGSVDIEALVTRVAQGELPAAPVDAPTPVSEPAAAITPTAARAESTLVEPVVASVAADAVPRTFEFELPDLDGRLVTAADFIGRPTAVVFWSTTCGFCTRMLPELHAWEARPAGERASLLVVSTGSVEANRDLGLTLTVVLDSGFTVGPRHGARGTPSAIVVGADGRILNEARSGTPAVLAAFEFAAGLALSPDVVPVRAASIDDELLADGSMVIYDSRIRRALSLNGTAALVWETCDGTQTLGEIVADVAEVYPDAPALEHDVRALVGQLLRQGLLSLRPADAVPGANAPAPVLHT